MHVGLPKVKSSAHDEIFRLGFFLSAAWQTVSVTLCISNQTQLC